MNQQVILVNKNDQPIGVEEKLKVHQKGNLHRAFSIFIFNNKKELLLQKRAKKKYHCPDLWSNTCCSHPHPVELTEQAAIRRLKEEMGFSCPIKEIFSFTYKAKFKNGLIENEYDHVFVGKFEGSPQPDPFEAAAWRWVNLDELKKDIAKRPEKYTSWLKIVVNQYLKFFNNICN